VESDQCLAHHVEIVAIAEVEALMAQGAPLCPPFTSGEVDYARSKSDPARRLAARLAAKRALCVLLGAEAAPGEIEVLPASGGPPTLRLTSRVRMLLAQRGAQRALVSLTHGETHAAASVVLVARP
jgi:phosphopantetheinyl transferase (holo-ACP synthase)